MSETETAPQGGDAAASESAATEAEALAPGTEGAATETPPETTADEKPSRADRRIAAMSARLAAQGAEIERLRAGQSPQQLQPDALPQTPEELERLIDQRAEAKAAQERARERTDRFHTEGRAAHADWAERCQSLMSMGADAGLSHILVEMEHGARVAGALADDPEALERIAAIKTERGRAISLGMYAAQLAEKPAPPVRRVSNAPPPIRPVTGSAPVAFNEYTANSEQLVAYYDQQARKARGL